MGGPMKKMNFFSGLEVCHLLEFMVARTIF